MYKIMAVLVEEGGEDGIYSSQTLACEEIECDDEKLAMQLHSQIAIILNDLKIKEGAAK